MTPPIVSMPSDSGVTSRSRTSLTSPARTPAWIAAPTATTSSGLTPRCGSLPPNICLTASMTAGMRVMPPTSTTSSISDRLEARVAQGLADRPARLVDQVGDQVFELGARQRDHQVLGPARVGRDVRQVDLGRGRRGELDLGLLGGLLESLEGLRVGPQVDPLVALELGQQPLDDALVEVVAAEVRVAVGRLDLEDALAQLQDRDVEGAAAQVVDGDLLVVLLVQAVGQGRGGGLVDDPLDVEAGDAARVLGGLALGVVEVGRDGDDRLGDLLAQIRLRVRLELLQDHGADLGRRVALAVGEGDLGCRRCSGLARPCRGQGPCECATSGSSNRRPMKRLME